MSYPYPYLGPIAPENNPPIKPQYYAPSRFVISALTLGILTHITTSVPHNYVVGQEIRVLIPPFYGSYQISGRQGYVVSIPSSTQVIVDINSTGANAFISSPAYGPTQPQIVAIGDVNNGVINGSGIKATGTFIPGSFINISPN